MNVAFWNLGELRAASVIAALLHERSIELGIFVEGRIDGVELLSRLNSQDRRWRCVELVEGTGKQVYTVYHSRLLRRVADGQYASCLLWREPGFEPAYIAAVHLPSLLHRQRNELDARARDAAAEIRDFEALRKSSRLVLVGDFNMDPHDDGMLCHNGFNAVMCRRIAGRERRKVGEGEFPYFYNPMWRFLGAHGGAALGTYYYGGGSCSPYWHAFDQVLVRPALLPGFDDRTVELVAAIGGTSLLTASGLPDAERFSDHLPLVFSFDASRDSVESATG